MVTVLLGSTREDAARVSSVAVTKHSDQKQLKAREGLLPLTGHSQSLKEGRAMT